MTHPAAAHGSAGAPPYDPPRGRYDEAYVAPGRPRPRYRRVLDAINRLGPQAAAAEVRRRVRRERLTFDGRPFALDPIPRILTEAEWLALGAGLVQRARALEEFLADAYGERRIVAAGVIPAEAIDSSSHYEARLAGVPVPGRRLAVCGFDVVRRPNGEFAVLEDNVRTPSGIAYALGARALYGAGLARRAGVEIADLEDVPRFLRQAILEGTPGDLEGAAVVLTDGRGGAFAEHRRLAAAASAILATAADIRAHGGRLLTGDGQPIAVIYRRTNEDRLWDPDDGTETALGRLLAEPVAAGRVGVVNAFGSGVGDDKLTHGYVERMIRFYLSEEPAIRSVASVDLELSDPPAKLLENLDEVVVKPREGEGGEGVLVPDDATPAERTATRAALRSEPEQLVAQEQVALSTAPCVGTDGALEPHLVDLRAFALACPEGFRLAPCALTRFAPEGSAKVNSSAGGGGKDTWVLA